MIDLHTHTLFSDGVLIPSEMVYRAKVKGYTAIALTDHGDYSTFEIVIPRIKLVAAQLTKEYGITVIPGIEITYVPPRLIAQAVTKCRALGARVVVVHGETPAETVPPGTNHAAVLSDADILAHPGHIDEQDVAIAARRGVCLEITTRRGHNATNSHVARSAKKCEARLVLNTDSHAPDDLMNQQLINKTISAAGLKKDDFAHLQLNALMIVKKRR